MLCLYSALKIFFPKIYYLYIDFVYKIFIYKCLQFLPHFSLISLIKELANYIFAV